MPFSPDEIFGTKQGRPEIAKKPTQRGISPDEIFGKPKAGLAAGLKHFVPDVAAGTARTAASLAVAPFLPGSFIADVGAEPVTTEKSSPWARAMEATIAPERFVPKGITQKLTQVPEQAAAIVPGRTPPELRDTGLNPLKWKHPIHTVSAGFAEILPSLTGAGLTTKALRKVLGPSDKVMKLFTLGKWSPEITKSGLAGASLLAPQIAESFYDEAIQEGADPVTAGALALTDAAFATVTEGLALPGIVSGKGKWFTRFLKGGVQEGLFEEGIQGLLENTLKIAGWEDPRPTSQRLLDGLSQSIITGFLSGGALGAITPADETQIVNIAKGQLTDKLIKEGVSEADAKNAIKELDRRQSLTKIVRDAMKVDSGMREAMNKRIDIALEDMANIHEGYILTNAETGGVIQESRIADKIKVADEARIKNIMASITGAIQRPYEISFPAAFRNNLKLLINQKLEAGQDEAEIVLEFVNYFNTPQQKKVIYLSEPAKDPTDIDNTVFDVSSVAVTKLSKFLTNNFSKGVVPEDIIIRQSVMKGQSEGWAKDVRDIIKGEYATGLKHGLWSPPPPPPVPAPSPVTPTPVTPTAEQAAEEAAARIGSESRQGEFSFIPVPSELRQEELSEEFSPTHAFTGKAGSFGKNAMLSEELRARVGQPVEVVRGARGSVKITFSDGYSAITGFQNISSLVKAKSEQQKLLNKLKTSVPKKTEKISGPISPDEVAIEETALAKLKLVPASTIDEEIVPPSTFAEQAAVEKVKYDIAVEDSISNTDSEDVQAMVEMASKLQEQLGRIPTVQELAQALGWDISYLQDIRKLFAEEYQRKFTSSLSDEQLEDIKANAQDYGFHGENLSFTARSNVLDILRNWADIINNPTAASVAENAMQWLEDRMADKRVRKEATRKRYREAYEKMIGVSQILSQEGKEALPVINDFFFNELKEELVRIPEEDMTQLLDRLYFALTDDSITIKDSTGEIVHTINKGSPSAIQIEYVINAMEEKHSEESAKAVPWAMTEAEKKGGASFTVLWEPMTVTDTNGNEFEIEVGEYDLVKMPAGYELTVGDVVHIVPEAFLSSLVDNDNAELNTMDFNMGAPFPGMDKSLFELLNPIKRFFSGRKADKHPGLVRRQPVRSILEILRFFHLDPDGFITFWAGKSEKEKVFLRKPKFTVAPGKAKEILYRDKVFTEAIFQISQTTMQGVYKEFSSIVDKKLDTLGPLKQTEKQFIKDELLKLCSYASEQVTTNEQFPVTGKFAFTDNSSDKHINAAGVLDIITHKAYYQTVLKFHQILGVPYTPVDEARWADPNGAREPIYWELLGKYGGEDLQRWLLYVKSQIEYPLLKEQLSRGIYNSADIWSKVKRGYTRKFFDVTEIQKQGGFGKYVKESALASKEKPSSTHKTFEEFVQAGETGGWVPIEDYMASITDYMMDSLSGIHQADTLLPLHAVTSPAFHYRDEYRKVTPNTMSFEVPVILYSHTPLVVKEAARLSKALGEDISPHAVLESWGFLQGKSMPGLVAWWRGAFQKPFVYRPVADLFNAMFEKVPHGGGTQSVLDLYNLMKHIKTLNPVDSIGVWAGLPYARLGPVKYVTLIPRALWYTAKGLRQGFTQLMTGTPVDSTLNLNRHQYLHLALMTGWQMASYSNAMVSIYDWMQRPGMFPERFNKIQRTGEWIRTIGGVNAALFNQMLANDMYQAWEKVYLENKSKNMSDMDAASRASSYMNNASFMLNRSIYNREGRWVNLFLFSRGLFVGAIRNFSLLTYRTPFIGPTLKKMGLYNYHTGRISRLTNSFLNAEMTEMDMDVTSVQLFRDTAALTAYALIAKGIIQYVLSFRDDKDKDEHGEIGAELGDKAKKRYILENEANGFGKVRLGQKENFQQIYADYQLFRWQRDLFDVGLGTLNRNWGKGADVWMANKLGLFATSWWKVLKNDDGEGNPIFNPEDPLMAQWLDRLRFVGIQELVPIGSEWLLGQPKLMSEDPFRNAALTALDILGVQITKGEPVSMTDWKTARERRKSFRSESFTEKMIEPSRKISNTRMNKLIEMFRKSTPYEKAILEGQIKSEIERRNAPEQWQIKKSKTQIRRAPLRGEELLK